MAGVGPDDLYQLAAELRDVATEALDSIPDFAGLEALEGAPERVFVSPGAPVADCCEFLAVHVNSIADRFARPADGGAPKLNIPRLIVTSMRCVPQGEGEEHTYQPPTVVALEEAARQLDADGWALWNHIYNLIEAEQFLTRCAHVAFVQMQSIAPEGGCAGWQLAFDAQLDGYREEIST